MAQKTDRLAQNVSGAYYVDSSCVDCDLCRNTAPDFFKRDEETGFSFVYRQPVTPVERVLAEDARQGCPTESIGNDGLIESPPVSMSAHFENINLKAHDKGPCESHKS